VLSSCTSAEQKSGTRNLSRKKKGCQVEALKQNVESRQRETKENKCQLEAEKQKVKFYLCEAKYTACVDIGRSFAISDHLC
jgi:hypothetical protein